METKERRRVVIVGGGFAGLFAARALRRAPVDITLVDVSAHHLFQPLLYQCATGILSEGKIAAPLRDLLHRHRNVDCEMAEVTGIDAARRQVLATRPLGEAIELPYDYLVLAAGVEQSYFGHDEFAALAPGMKTIADALTIRRRVFGAFEMAETAADPAERRHWLTFALVGAGPTGVELAGQIREVATKTLRREFRHIEPDEARVLLFDGGAEPLASFGPALSAKARATLEKLGVEIHPHSIVTDVDENGLAVRNGDGTITRQDAGTVLWTAGVQAPPFAATVARAVDAHQDRAGRISVNPDLTIPGHPEIYVVGDMMSLNKLPGVAEVAMQGGMYVGRRIRRDVSGHGDGKPFRYRDLGSAAYISRGRAVVSMGRLHVGGFIGWWLWLFIHIGFLTGFRNRLGTVLTWWLAFTRDVRRERTFTMHDVGAARDVYSAPPEPAGRTVAKDGPTTGPQAPAPRAEPGERPVTGHRQAKGP